MQRSKEEMMNICITQMIQRDKVPKCYYEFWVRKNRLSIKNLDNTFVDQTLHYKKRLIYQDALKSITRKTGALFPRMKQFES
ncbi:hypothetical protein HID58_057100 [Brassica napus]|uniref:Uncharacterized protein n=1 Tax=Brassica napus TaxID=3708 RepID=A0ABQ8AQ51_BRANA|nr:hypothetical protein HID58_057100 [Brassica napus]